MRKPLIWITAFLALTFVGDRFFGFLLQNMSEKSQFRYSRLYYTNEAADILFVGNSRGLTFFQPEVEKITGSKTMNLSYNGMPADLAKVLVMDYLDRHPAPKTMVVDITLCDRENELFKSSFNLYAQQSQRLTDLIKANVSTHRPEATSLKVDTLDIYAGKKVYYGGLVSHLFRYNTEIFQRVLYHKNKTDEDWLIDRIIGETAAHDTANMKSYPVRMFPLMVAHLKEMIDYAKGKGVEVKLVINPYLPAFAALPAMRDSFLIPLKTYVETQTGMPVSDFSTALTERDNIGDYQHANKKGSKLYMQILKSAGVFDSQNLSSIGDLNRVNVNISPYETSKIDTLTDFTTPSDEIYPPSRLSRDVPSVSTPKNSVAATSKSANEAFERRSVDFKTLKKKKRIMHWVAVDTLF